MISRQSIRELILFSLPIIFGQLGQMLIGVGDVFVAAKFSTNAVAAIGVGNAVIAPLLMVGIGFSIAISPLLSTYRGRGEKINSYFISSLLFALSISIILMMVLWGLNFFVPMMGFDKAIEQDVFDYIQLALFSLPGALLFVAAKEYLQAEDRVFFANLLSIAAVLFNLLFNTVFVFGFGPIEGMGIKGLAYATILTRYLMAIILVIYCFYGESYQWKLKWDYLIELFKNGVMVASGVLLEVLAFCLVTLLIGKMPAIESAAHSIVLNLASLTFMIPLAIASGVGSKVGLFLGERKKEKIREVIFSGVTISLVVMSFSGLIFAFFPGLILGFFSDDKNLEVPAGKILRVVAAFQLFDGLQVTLSGVLRGLQRPKATTLMAIIGYWILGLPVGYYLAFSENLGAYGLWLGLALGLLVVSLGLLGATMNAFKKLVFSLSVFFILNFLWSFPVSAQEKIGVIKIARGEVLKRDKKSGKETVLTAGIEVFAQEILITGNKSYLKLELIDETTIDLGSSSSFEIENFEMKNKHDKNVLFNFIKGSLRAQVKNKVNNGEILLKAKGVAMGVRGTTIFSEIKRNKKTETQVALSEGQVELELPMAPKKSTQIMKRGKLAKTTSFILPEGVVFSTEMLASLGEDVEALREKLVKLTPEQLTELKAQSESEELKVFLSTILDKSLSSSESNVLSSEVNENEVNALPAEKKGRKKKHWKELLNNLEKKPEALAPPVPLKENKPQAQTKRMKCEWQEECVEYKYDYSGTEKKSICSKSERVKRDPSCQE